MTGATLDLVQDLLLQARAPRPPPVVSRASSLHAPLLGEPLERAELGLSVEHASFGVHECPMQIDGLVFVGRGGVDVTFSLLWDIHASRVHARMWVEGGQIFIADEGSHNGTYVDGRRIEGPARLEPESLVRIGSTQIRAWIDARGEASASPRADAPRHAALEIADWFLGAVADDRLYTALDLPPTCSDREIRDRTRHLWATFDDGLSAVPAGAKARLARARDLSADVARRLARGRLDYDFSHGHIRAEDRLRRAADGDGPSIDALCEAWRRAHPHRAKVAEATLRRACAARREHRNELALQLAAEARHDAPFCPEIRGRLDFWRMLASARR